MVPYGARWMYFSSGTSDASAKCDAFSLNVLQETRIGMRLRMLPFILPNRHRLDVNFGA
jgi:hypothetical protein